MSTLQLNDIELYYEIKGEGKPLFLLAGLMSDSNSWMPASDFLAKKYMVITPDNRCVGRTKPLGAACSIKAIAEDVLELADHLGVEKFNVVGHSMGGFVALELATFAPSRISSMVLEATSAINSDRNNKLFESWSQALGCGQDLNKWFTEVFKWIFTENVTGNDVTLNMFLDYSINYPYLQPKEAFDNQIKAIREFDGRALLPQIMTKTFILCAENDRLFSPQKSLAAFAELPNKQFCVVEEAAHALHAEKIDEFVALVSEFIG